MLNVIKIQNVFTFIAQCSRGVWILWQGIKYLRDTAIIKESSHTAAGRLRKAKNGEPIPQYTPWKGPFYTCVIGKSLEFKSKQQDIL